MTFMALNFPAKSNSIIDSKLRRHTLQMGQYCQSPALYFKLKTTVKVISLFLGIIVLQNLHITGKNWKVD